MRFVTIARQFDIEPDEVYLLVKSLTKEGYNALRGQAKFLTEENDPGYLFVRICPVDSTKYRVYSPPAMVVANDIQYTSLRTEPTMLMRAQAVVALDGIQKRVSGNMEKLQKQVSEYKPLADFFATVSAELL